jgi:hypothetical protein
MNATLARKLRFSDVAYAINATPKSLRLWLQRDLVKLHSPRPESGWTEYSFVDVAILALVRQLANWGVDVSTASEIANEIITKLNPLLRSLKNPKNMPAGALASMWTNKRVYLFCDGDNWQTDYVRLYHSELDSARNEGFDPSLPSGVAALRRELEPAAVFLSIDVESVLRTALERANESVNEGRSDGDAA